MIVVILGYPGSGLQNWATGRANTVWQSTLEITGVVDTADTTTTVCSVLTPASLDLLVASGLTGTLLYPSTYIKREWLQRTDVPAGLAFDTDLVYVRSNRASKLLHVVLGRGEYAADRL